MQRSQAATHGSWRHRPARRTSENSEPIIRDAPLKQSETAPAKEAFGIDSLENLRGAQANHKCTKHPVSDRPCNSGKLLQTALRAKKACSKNLKELGANHGEAPLKQSKPAPATDALGNIDSLENLRGAQTNHKRTEHSFSDRPCNRGKTLHSAL